MSVIIVFLLVVFGFSGWWLAHKGLMSKPWLEVGPNPVGGPGPSDMPTEKVALGIFLAVVGALFALFASAYYMRQEFGDWQAMPIPRVVWWNTLMLVLASVTLQCALVAVRQRDRDTVRLSLGTGAIATLAFLAGQIAAWRELAASGYLLAGGPANSFFYLLSGLHGLHVLGGLVALARTISGAWGPEARGAGSRGVLRLRVELCTTYWHFLLLVWLGLLALFTGRAAELIDICRQILT